MKSKRLDYLEKIILENKQMSWQEMVDTTNVSISTLRRDVDELLKREVIKKVHGGVKSKETQVPSLQTRHTSQHEGKIKIGAKSAQLLEDGDVVFIDSGTTTVKMIPFIEPEMNLTVLTNSLSVINEVNSLPNVTIYVIGSLFKPSTQSFVKMTPDVSIQDFNVNKAFMAATGVSLSHGLSNSDPLEYLLKKDIAALADEVYLLIDESKFEKSTVLSYAQLRDIDAIISTSIPHKYQDFLERHNIHFIQA